MSASFRSSMAARRDRSSNSRSVRRTFTTSSRFPSSITVAPKWRAPRLGYAVGSHTQQPKGGAHGQSRPGCGSRGTRRLASSALLRPSGSDRRTTADAVRSCCTPSRANNSKPSCCASARLCNSTGSRRSARPSAAVCRTTRITILSCSSPVMSGRRLRTGTAKNSPVHARIQFLAPHGPARDPLYGGAILGRDNLVDGRLSHASAPVADH